MTTKNTLRDSISKSEYSSVHHWLRTNYGNASRCENKGCQKSSLNFEWALIKGKNYERNRKNYFQLCKSCHSAYDITDEGKRRISLHNRGKVYTKDQLRNRYIPIVQFDMKGKLLKRFSSVLEATKFTGIASPAICSMLRGRSKYNFDPISKVKYTWKYE